MWSFFDLKMVLNLPCAVERLQRTVVELSRVGLTDYQVFPAISDIGPHQSFNRSINAMIIAAEFANASNVLILEDDVVFIDTTHLQEAIQELPDDWDILYLGANVAEKDFLPPIRYSPHLCRVFNAWTTHAVAFNRKCFSYLINKQPGFSDQMFDNWLSSQLHNLKAYCVTPIAAVQQPGQSLIWGNSVDYYPVFAKSDNILINTQ